MSTFALRFNKICEMDRFEERLRKDLHQFRLSTEVQLKRMGYHMTNM